MKISQITMLIGLMALTGSTTAHALEVGDAAPCVVLNQIAPDAMEKEHCIRDKNEGTQFTVIEFFSATCSDCQMNLPHFNQLAMESVHRATFRLVGIDRDEQLLRDYIKKNAQLISFETALDTNRDAKTAYNVVATPTLFVLDSDNKIVFKHVGVLKPADMCALESVIGKGN